MDMNNGQRPTLRKSREGKRLLTRLLAILLICAALISCTENIPQIPAYGKSSGQTVRTTVDSDSAKYFLEHYLKGERSRPDLDTAIDTIERDIGAETPPRALLKNIADRHSTDFAALVLWQSLLRQSKSQRAQDVFYEEVAKLEGHTLGTPAPLSVNLSEYLIVFVPGWFYKSQPESGADFAKPRQVLSDMGARTVLLDIEENGSVEHNGDLIAEQLNRLSRSERKIILVSASKGGPEVALALTQLHRTGLDHGVKAWVNIGGTLRGSALADKALAWPTRWYVKLFVIGGRSFDGIESLTTSHSAKRADDTMVPPNVLVMNYVGIPLSGQVTARARLGYSLLRKDGPNDGLTYIVDEISTGSITVPELGLDHFFADPQIHIKTIALMNTVVRLVETHHEAVNEIRADAVYLEIGGRNRLRYQLQDAQLLTREKNSQAMSLNPKPRRFFFRLHCPQNGSLQKSSPKMAEPVQSK